MRVTKSLSQTHSQVTIIVRLHKLFMAIYLSAIKPYVSG